MLCEVSFTEGIVELSLTWQWEFCVCGFVYVDSFQASGEMCLFFGDMRTIYLLSW